MPEKVLSEIQSNSSTESCPQAPFSSNCVRLSASEWIVIAVFFLPLFYFGPVLWEQLEKFEPGSDYRLPYELSNDYWLYSRYCRWACHRYETLVIGDSVIWGHFVSKQNTLSHYLNQITGREKFANLGVDGIHPVALAGLLKYYGREISGKNIILHLNPLWMSSGKHDLQIKKEFHFNHPELVPQFIPNIPCYKDSYSSKLSAVLQRYVPFVNWTSHLKITYFESMDLPQWTFEHPYKNPLKAITSELPTSENHNQNEHISWTDKGIAKRDFQWVELDTSLQWRFFRHSIEILKARDNTVFVLVGPFNEHILKGKSIDTYQRMKGEIEAWLQQNNIPYYMPAVLPSELYRDASHPLSAGYNILAKQILQNESFKSNILCTSRDFTSPDTVKCPE